jgi:ribosomal protein S18 acetylase RimI-like enzyme
VTLLERLQRSLGAIAAIGREQLRIGPFDAFVDHLREPKYYSFALADPGAAAEDLAAALVPLREAFSSRARTARTEFIEEVVPAMEAVLVAGGWQISERIPVMVCTPDRLAPPLSPEGLAVQTVDGDSPAELLLGFLRAQRLAFADESPITEEEIARWRERAPRQFAAVGLVGDEISGTAVCTPIYDGVTEVVGVATPRRFRRRGIAAAVTATVVSAAFEAGAEVAWLTAAGPSAQGIYARSGFSVQGTLLAYDAPT